MCVSVRCDTSGRIAERERESERASESESESAREKSESKSESESKREHKRCSSYAKVLVLVNDIRRALSCLF